jgi:hypothetical protein
MTRAELEQRLGDIDRSIEGIRAEIYVAEQERDRLRFELRRLMHAETNEAA